ncbi:MAG: ABC-F type ribosomal protection protein [Clostridia bacterium]|nr:ABC-F type ribosomal protection protein [Clostridia bacterium]
MARIQISHLTFGYEGSPDLIFDDASFQIDTDWKLGFIGRNGRGKTTLLRILSGDLDGGNAVSAPVKFDYFPFSVHDQQKTPLEIAADMDAEGQIWRFMKEIAELEVEQETLSRPFSSLSGGEQAKVLLAALFSRENRFLLIDEPTNHLDMRGRKIVSRYLNGKKGFILVSHDRTFLDGCVDHVLSINRANIEVQKGNFSTWEENKRRQDEFEINQNEKLKREISSLRAAARQARSFADKVESSKFGLSPDSHEKPKNARAYAGEQSRRMQQRRKNLETRMDREIEEKESLLKNLELSDDLKIFPLAHPSGRLVECRGACIGYGDRKVLSDLRFTLYNGDILALTGRNGCGKTSLIKALTGEIAPLSGEIRLSSGLIVSLVPQQACLQGSLRDLIRAEGMDETQFKTILRKLNFSRDQFEKPMDAYSAGQQKKVLLARSLCQRAHLYIWDEPLNYIDVLSRMQLERLIQAFKPTMILVEHDQAFLQNIGAKVLQLDDPVFRWTNREK